VWQGESSDINEEISPKKNNNFNPYDKSSINDPEKLLMSQSTENINQFINKVTSFRVFNRMNNIPLEYG
jgi:hypothetical protein